MVEEYIGLIGSMHGVLFLWFVDSDSSMISTQCMTLLFYITVSDNMNSVPQSECYPR